MTRETLKCPSCGLNQFVNAAETCKRCKRALRVVELVLAPRTLGRPEKASLQDAREILGFAAHLSVELKKLRLAMVNVSQRELARRMGCQRTYVSKCEIGRAQPTLPSLQRFAIAFGVPLWQILKNAEEAMHKEKVA